MNYVEILDPIENQKLKDNDIDIKISDRDRKGRNKRGHRVRISLCRTGLLGRSSFKGDPLLLSLFISSFKPGGFGKFRSNIETGVCCEPLWSKPDAISFWTKPAISTRT
jgi:hypothetical protein